MREVFVTELVKDVLGPRDGVREILRSDPLYEYITGVLAPFHIKRTLDMEESSTIPAEPTEGDEDEILDLDIEEAPSMPAAFHPKSRPISMGISFVLEVEKNEKPKVHFCLTWARYFPDNSQTSGGWQRKPRSFVFEDTIDRDKVYNINSSGCVSEKEREITLHIRCHRVDKTHFISIFLVNRIEVIPEKNKKTNEDIYKLKTEYHIFQPQIRLIFSDGTEIKSYVQSSNEEDEKEMAFLYKDRPTLARGHMCSAIWKKIDPCQKLEKNHPSFDLKFPPFYWIDGEILSNLDRNRFSHPDIRSDFTPLYSIPSPTLDWPVKYGNLPELHSEVLSECWDVSKLKTALYPLIQGYQLWISELITDAAKLNQEDITDRLIARCKSAQQRMIKGLEIICNDNDARLSFCIANQAINMAYRWKNKESSTGLIWKPFQLAFILMTLESIINRTSPDREVCDLLWVPTGAGKTESYLAIALFTLAYRRRFSKRKNPESAIGVSVITRYTLRLLTIQQFRRTLTAITALEFLRVKHLGLKRNVGWIPQGYDSEDEFIWGSTPFSIGLWVGKNVTPNKLNGTTENPGAIQILQGTRGEGEPAQVLNCPACDSILAVPSMGLKRGRYVLYITAELPPKGGRLNLKGIAGRYGSIDLISDPVIDETSPGYFVISLPISIHRLAKFSDIEDFWKEIKYKMGEITIFCAKSFFPGYFLRKYKTQTSHLKAYDFDIICPNPKCPLHSTWSGGSPAGSIHGTSPYVQETTDFDDGNRYITVQDAFRMDNTHTSNRIPIPALTVDEQIYQKTPSIIVATVDKFARPAYEPACAGIFGNVNYHHCIWGYYRVESGHPSPSGKGNNQYYIQVFVHGPPDLILQDELHLIEGPLGSHVGFYETAIDMMCKHNDSTLKYIASTATIRKAEEQIKSIFLRKLQIFPPPGLSYNDSFFLRNDRFHHPLDDSDPGRLYLGICAPGRGPLLPVRNIWARLMQTAEIYKNDSKIDSFWTMAGYFNAIRELAGVRALYRQDIPQRIEKIVSSDTTLNTNRRPLPDDRAVELSSRTNSTDLPSILDMLSSHVGENPPDSLFTTSMFGTGIDIPRIGLMVVHGQPKSTSSYIQSTGRVGRKRGALVVTFLRATRPRDLNHYEFFSGYHSQLHRFIEPITVYPFSPGIMKRAAGPLSVFILRNIALTANLWHPNPSATEMANHRMAREINDIFNEFEKRVISQPGLKNKDVVRVKEELASKLDAWHSVARRNTNALKYVEYAIFASPKSPVVLGDPEHLHSQFEVVYENSPQSMREVEETTCFES